MHKALVSGKPWLLVFIVFALVNATSFAATEGRGCGTVVYEGGGAGKVAFDMRTHMAKELTCDDCHEGRGLSSALFEMKRYSNSITMRKMEFGRSCGKCHPVAMNDMSNCSYCHRK